MKGRKEGNVLFNDALDTFYLRLYGVRQRERGNPLPSHGLLFPISSKDSFICNIPTERITHTTAFVTPVVEHWLEREKGCGKGCGRGMRVWWVSLSDVGF